MTFQYKVLSDGVDTIASDVGPGFLFEQDGTLFVRAGEPTTPTVLQPPPNEGDVAVINAATFQPGWARGSDPCRRFGRVAITR